MAARSHLRRQGEKYGGEKNFHSSPAAAAHQFIFGRQQMIFSGRIVYFFEYIKHMVNYFVFFLPCHVAC